MSRTFWISLSWPLTAVAINPLLSNRRQPPHRTLAGKYPVVWAWLALAAASFSAGSLAASEPNEVPGNLSSKAQSYLAGARTGRLPSMGDMQADPVVRERSRKALGKMFERMARGVDPDYYLTRQDLGSVTGYWVNSPAPAAPGNVIIYLHGGGFVLGSAQTNVASALRIGAAAGVPVLSVEYRLAPEHPFPAAVQDAVEAYEWLLQQGYKGSQIGIYGDSAGGCLSIAAALAIRDLGLPHPAAVVALSPVGDLTPNGDTRITLRDIDPVLRMDLESNKDAYAGDADRSDPLLSPVYANYTNFPPLLIQAGTREILLSDAVRIARKARDDGAEYVELDIRDGMWHGWHEMPELPEADASCDDVGEFFNRWFAQSGAVRE